jgi:hypothetical protein
MKLSLRCMMRLDLLCLVAFALAVAILGSGWYLERFNVKEFRDKAGENMRAYLQEVAKNNSLRSEIEQLRPRKAAP